MDITACVSFSCNQRHQCLRYMLKPSRRQSYSDFHFYGTCHKIDISPGDRVLTPREADLNNEPLHEDIISSAI